MENFKRKADILIKSNGNQSQPPAIWFPLNFAILHFQNCLHQTFLYFFLPYIFNFLEGSKVEMIQEGRSRRGKKLMA